MLDYNFAPELNIPFERHLFRKISQESGRLQQRAATCEFCVNKDDYIGDRLRQEDPKKQLIDN